MPKPTKHQTYKGVPIIWDKPPCEYRDVCREPGPCPYRPVEHVPMRWWGWMIITLAWLLTGALFICVAAIWHALLHRWGLGE